MIARRFVISCSHREGHREVKSFWINPEKGFGVKRFAKIFPNKRSAEDEGLCEVNSFFYEKQQADELDLYPKYGPAIIEECDQ